MNLMCLQILIKHRNFTVLQTIRRQSEQGKEKIDAKPATFPLFRQIDAKSNKKYCSRGYARF